MWSDRIIFYWGGFKKWMLSLLLNKNPCVSLGVVSHRLLWSLVVWQEGASEVSRQEDRSIDILVNGWMECSSFDSVLCLTDLAVENQCSYSSLLLGNPWQKSKEPVNSAKRLISFRAKIFLHISLFIFLFHVAFIYCEVASFTSLSALTTLVVDCMQPESTKCLKCKCNRGMRVVSWWQCAMKNFFASSISFTWRLKKDSPL